MQEWIRAEDSRARCAVAGSWLGAPQLDRRPAEAGTPVESSVLKARGKGKRVKPAAALEDAEVLGQGRAIHKSIYQHRRSVLDRPKGKEENDEDEVM